MLPSLAMVFQKVRKITFLSQISVIIRTVGSRLWPMNEVEIDIFAIQSFQSLFKGLSDLIAFIYSVICGNMARKELKVKQAALTIIS